MKVLSIDASSHTGWAILDNDQLISYGKIDVPCKDKKWPLGIHQWAKEISEQIFSLIVDNPTDLIIIERANSSRFRESQNVLDWLHFHLIDLLIDANYASKLLYVDSSAWRKACGLKLTAQQKKQNKMAKQASNSGTILKINGKRKGRVTKKHLAVDYVNAKFNLSFKLKDNDIAEAICLGSSYFLQ
jgi:hypothetical protein